MRFARVALCSVPGTVRCAGTHYTVTHIINFLFLSFFARFKGAAAYASLVAVSNCEVYSLFKDKIYVYSHIHRVLNNSNCEAYSLFTHNTEVYAHRHRVLNNSNCEVYSHIHATRHATGNAHNTQNNRAQNAQIYACFCPAEISE